MLDRLIAIDESQCIKDMKHIKVTVSNKRRRSVSSSSSGQYASSSGCAGRKQTRTALDYLRTQLPIEQPEESETTASAEKQARTESLGTPEFPTGTPNTSGSTPGKQVEVSSTFSLVQRVKEEASSISECLHKSSSVPAGVTVSIIQKLGKLQRITVVAKAYLLNHPGQVLPEDKWKELQEASHQVCDQIYVGTGGIADEQISRFLNLSANSRGGDN